MAGIFHDGSGRKLCADYNSVKIESVQECMDAVSQIRKYDQRAHWGGKIDKSFGPKGCIVSTGFDAKKISWNTNANPKILPPSFFSPYAVCIGNGTSFWFRIISL